MKLQNNNTDAGPIVFFDGHCALCNRTVSWLMKRDRSNVLRFANLQSQAAAQLLNNAAAEDGEDPTAPDTIQLVDQQGTHDRSTAVLRALQHLRWPWSWFAILLVIPRPIRDAVYRFIARHRYRWFGRTEMCGLLTDAQRKRILD